MRKILSSPIWVDFCITWFCNMKCKHCFAKLKNTNIKDLPFKDLKIIIKRLYEAKVFFIILTGGEPLIREDFFSIVDYLKKFHFHLGLNTNATLITEDISKKIKDKGFKLRISVSFDGSDKETYEALRGENTYSKAIKGIENLIKYNKNIRLFTVVNRLNYNKLEDIVKFAKSLKAPYIEFNNLRTLENKTCFKDISLNPSQKIESLEKILELKDKYKNYIRGSFLHMAEMYKKIITTPKRELSKLKPKFLQNCDAGFGMAAIRADGKITPCYAMLDYVVGDLFKENLKNIWQNSIPLKNFRKIQNINLLKIEPCKKCLYKGVCNGGCRASAYYESKKKKLNIPDFENCYLYLIDAKNKK